MNVQSRLFDFISSKKISISDFERACGLSNGYVHKIKNSVGKRGLLDIQRKFPELNTDWLLTGEGEMLNDTSSYIANSDHHGTSVAGNGNNVNTTSALEKALESLMEQQRLTANPLMTLITSRCLLTMRYCNITHNGVSQRIILSLSPIMHGDKR